MVDIIINLEEVFLFLSLDIQIVDLLEVAGEEETGTKRLDYLGGVDIGGVLVNGVSVFLARSDIDYFVPIFIVCDSHGVQLT